MAPPPDPNGAQLISEEWEAGSKAAQGALAGGAGSNSAPKAGSIDLGQSEAEVEAVLGKPQTIIKLTAVKVIYVYADMRITFTGGKVTTFGDSF